MREHLLYIDGKWRPGGAGTTIATSPSSGETIAQLAVADPADVDAAVAAASAAWPAWAGTSAFDRAAWCGQIVNRIGQRRDELAHALTEDQGKPLVAEAFDEVDELAEYFRMAGEDAKRCEGALPASTSADRRVLSTRVPLGVVGRGEPVELAVHDGRGAVRARDGRGQRNRVGARADHHGLLRAAGRGHRGGRPASRGVQLRPWPRPGGRGRAGRPPRVAGVGFVGSVATGASVAARAAGKTQLLELGGNGPMVILEDADLELATDAALEAAYLCAGQSCTAGERFLVAEPSATSSSSGWSQRPGSGSGWATRSIRRPRWGR